MRMHKRNQIKGQIKILFLSLGLALAFQNCSPPSGFHPIDQTSLVGDSAALSSQSDADDTMDFSNPAQGSSPSLPDMGSPDGTLQDQESSWHSYVGAVQDKNLVDSKLTAFFPSSNQAYQTIYVAPPGNRSGGLGTKASPYLNLKSAIEGASAGQRIYLLPGNYSISSNIIISRSGTAGRPMILSTDPDEFDPGVGKSAVIDFNQTTGFSVYGNYWLIENLEIRNTRPRTLTIDAQWVVVRNTHLHGNDPVGNNNNAIIVIDHPMRWEGFQNNPNLRQSDLTVLTTEMRHNFFLNNHIHDGEASDGGLNQGCTYSITAQAYYMDHLRGILGINANVSLATVQTQYYAPPTGEIYFYNNLVHDCHYGIATKNAGEGPIYILSNTIYDSSEGIKTTLSGALLRNNIIYGTNKKAMDVGIVIGWSGSVTGPLYDLFNASNTLVESNLIMNTRAPLSPSAVSWNLQIRNNIMTNFTDALILGWQGAFWYNGGGWPGVPSLGAQYDVDETNPYWTYFPQYLKDKKGDYKAIRFSGNAYTKIPLVRSAIEAEAGSSARIRVQGTRLDTSSTVDAGLAASSNFSTNASRPYTLSDTFKVSHPQLGPQR